VKKEAKSRFLKQLECEYTLKGASFNEFYRRKPWDNTGWRSSCRYSCGDLRQSYKKEKKNRKRLWLRLQRMFHLLSLP